MASISAPSGLPPTASVANESTHRFVHGLAYGLLVSMLIWAMIAAAVYLLV